MTTTSIDTLISDLEEAERHVIERGKEQEMLTTSLQDLEGKHAEYKKVSQMLGDSVKLIQLFSGGIRSGVIIKFEELLTEAVREIYSRDYTVKIEFEAKGGSFWADFFVLLPSGKRINMAKEGGGLRDVVSVLTQVLYLIMDPSRPAKFLVFDENLKNLDEWRSPDAVRLICKVINELGIQLIFITHNESMSSGKIELPNSKIYRFHLENDKSICEEISNSMAGISQ